MYFLLPTLHRIFPTQTSSQ